MLKQRNQGKNFAKQRENNKFSEKVEM